MTIVNAVSAFIAEQSASYADKVNSRYHNEASNFETIEQRVNFAISKLPLSEQSAVRNKLIFAATQWIQNNPDKHKWEDLDLCQSMEMRLVDILIDDTTQRELLINWVDKILRTWRDCQAMPISVYEISEDSKKQIPSWNGKDKLYAAWDGQHTIVAIYIIAAWALKLDPATIKVPVVVYKTSQRSEIRKTFMGKNSPEGNSLLTKYELFRQKVLGVRLDKTKNWEWEQAEEKQRYLEEAHLFVTGENAVDRNEPGAISRMKEIDHYSPAVIKDFTVYAREIQAITPRAIDTMEIALMCHWFHMARTSENPIIYTEDEIKSLARHLYDLFGADFKTNKDSTSNGPFWHQAKEAYTNWWDDYYAGSYDTPAKMVFKMLESTGIPFLHAQLRKTWLDGRIPRLNIQTPFRPKDSDLFM